MIDTNTWLIEFIGKNWMVMLIIYGVFAAMFPASKILAAIGETFSGLFPVFRKKPRGGSDNK